MNNPQNYLYNLKQYRYKEARNLFVLFLCVFLFSVFCLIQCAKQESRHYQEGLTAYEAELATWEADSAEFNAKISYFEHLHEVAENENDTAKLFQYEDSIDAYSPPCMSPGLMEYGFGYEIIFVGIGIIIPSAVLALIFLALTLIRYRRYKNFKQETLTKITQ